MQLITMTEEKGEKKEKISKKYRPKKTLPCGWQPADRYTNCKMHIEYFEFMINFSRSERDEHAWEKQCEYRNYR